MSGRGAISRSGKSNMTAVLDLAVTQQQTSHPEGTVYVVLDTSGSMAGAKINQVIESLREIIRKAPPYLRFCVRVFNTEVKLLVTKKKQYLDISRLFQDVRKTVGSCTALYDAWGVTLKEIPYDASKLDLVHVVIFTDGEDNCSKEYGLNSVLELSKEKIKGPRMQLSFIQAGRYSAASVAVGQMDKASFNVHNVEDSVAGIKFAFGKVSEAIQLQVQLRVSVGSGTGQITANLGNLSLGASGGRGINQSSLSALQFQLGNQTNTLFALQQGRTPTRTLEQRTRPAIMAGKPKTAMDNFPKHPQPAKKQEYQFSIKVENIPNNVKESDLREYFQQWGKCKIRTLVTAQKNSQMAIISYAGERERNFAVKNGGASVFKGQFLAVTSV